jgi:hypothetical protein
LRLLQAMTADSFCKLNKATRQRQCRFPSY